MPKAKRTTGACADLLGKLRAQRYELQHRVDALKEQEQEIIDYLIAELPKDDAHGVAGKTWRATIVVKPKPSVKDWAELYGWIYKNKRGDLLQRRLNEAAVKELWEDSRKVPGVETFNAVTVSVTKK